MNMNQRPLSKYTQEEIDRMTEEEFVALMEADNVWVRKHYTLLNESDKPRPKFNTIEELMKYYNAKPMEEVFNNISKLFEL